MRTAEEYIALYNMEPHREGGYYASAFRSENNIQTKAQGPLRALYSSIYFLFKENSISSLHRLTSDEIWHWYDGDTIHVFEINDSGELKETQLGIKTGKFQHLIKAGTWFGGKSSGSRSFALMGCTVHPGFDFDDFELGNRNYLLDLYPQHAEIIKALTFE